MGEWMGRENGIMENKTLTPMCPRDRSKGRWFLASLLVFSAPVYATSQCPPGVGPKDPLVNILGWLVVAAGVVVGGLLFSYVIRRSRGMRKFSRSVVVALGFAGMVLVWIGGLALATAFFFLQC